MTQIHYGFIGGGNMAASIIGGLIADGCPRDAILVSEPDTERRAQLQAQFGIQCLDDNLALAQQCDVVVLAVKPQLMAPVCKPLAVLQKQPLFVSVAAGIRLDALATWLGEQRAIIRTMPNTPALVQSGATALCANTAVNSEQREIAENLMRSVGLTVWLKEEQQIDAVTALSGSGPAYFFLILETLEEAGVKLGLPQETAHLLALQTAFGAAKMALESPESSATLRQRVTSPGGTTEKALGVLEDGHIRDLFTEALTQARNRAEELAAEFGAEQ